VGDEARRTQINIFTIEGQMKSYKFGAYLSFLFLGQLPLREHLLLQSFLSFERLLPCCFLEPLGLNFFLPLFSCRRARSGRRT